ncbi:MAG: DNA polymerase III subunit alpha [Lachnospiraceae bacterium]|nr:DNA polymerase III subunit alpha [Lachnospiraceae bacterium]
MPFTHLHVHTEYSLLDGSNKIKEYVRRVKNLGQTHAAITDHGTMYGIIDFYKEAEKQGVIPILGCEVYVAPNSRFDKELTGGEDRYYHLVLLAENNTGYANLMKIVSLGFTEGFYYRPRVDIEILREYHEGIIALSGCLAGEVQRYIQKGLIDEAEKTALKYRDCFGDGNFYLEIQDHGIPEQKTVATALLKISKKLGIPLVATNDVHYTNHEDEAAHDVLLCIQTNKKISDEDRMRYEGGQYYVKSEAEMKALFPYALEAVENTQIIAERCSKNRVTIEFGVPKMPAYEVPAGYDTAGYLKKLCYDGLKERYGEDIDAPAGTTGQTFRERLDFELEVIGRMGYVDYFLIVWDFIKYARENDIIVGPGRGSAAGSIVSYCLWITNIDPIRYNLLFERFLNPERISMPDIDIDFCYVRREEVIDYVSQKYGKDRVVQIATFGTMAARGVIRDVGRAMDLPYAFVDSVAKMIPAELNITLNRALEINSELRKLSESDEQVGYLIAMAKRLEGLPRHASTHAAGVVITSRPALEFVPLSRGSEGVVTTQFSMNTIEELGLLKMDFLGLRTLTVLQSAVDLIARSTGTTLDIDEIDFDDPAVFIDIGNARTEGVFQLESPGMKSFMKDLKPQNLEDVIAGISLYRPGPMDFIPRYVRGKNSAATITYSCPQLEPILAPTYGCIVYQEQVMQIVRDLGGYTLGRSDLLRRAMSKKKADVMAKERENFIYGNPAEEVPGCVSRGVDEKIASQIYDDMMDFAKYAFNKSHAACYAVVSYQTAYLKHYYPVEFMAALMTSVIDNSSKVAAYIMTCRSMGIALLPPDVNQGEEGFSVTGKSIRYALTAIKGVGHPVIKALVDERSKRGPFADLKDFIMRMSDRDMNKKAIENFIKAGALDSLPGTRKQFMSAYVQIVDGIQRNKKSNMAGQISLFDIADGAQKEEFELRLPDVGEYDKEMKLTFEKEVLGIYISGHPLEDYEEMWRSCITNTCADFYLDLESGATIVADNKTAVIGGIIADKTIKYTRNDKVMCFLHIEDLAGVCEVIVFPNSYEKFAGDLAEDNKIFVRGRVSLEEDKNGKLICEQIYGFDKIPKKLWLKFPDIEAYNRLSEQMYAILAPSDGNDTVNIYIEDSKQIKRLPPGKNVDCDRLLLDSLALSFGAENIGVKWEIPKDYPRGFKKD